MFVKSIHSAPFRSSDDRWHVFTVNVSAHEYFHCAGAENTTTEVVGYKGSQSATYERNIKWNQGNLHCLHGSDGACFFPSVMVIF